MSTRSTYSTITQHLIKNITIMHDDVYRETFIHCSKCGVTFSDRGDSKEFLKLQRKLNGKKGNLDVCFKCDSPRRSST